MVKIATAIIKFIRQSILYQTQGITSISLIIYVNNFKTIAFVIKTIKPNDKMKKGKDNIFNTGLIVIFITHKIIHQIRYVFKASIDIYEQSRHHKITQAQTSFQMFSHNKYVIAKSIKAFIIIDISIFMLHF